MTQPQEPSAPPLAASKVTLRLDLASGSKPIEGFDGVDIAPNLPIAFPGVDLLSYPWPWESESVAEIHCSHFLEHIPMEYVDHYGMAVPMHTPGAKDALFRLMEEVWRVLEPGGFATMIVPSAKNERAFQDPTHRRFFVPVTFAYFQKDQREAMGLSHYNVDPRLDFEINVATSCQQELNLLHPNVSSRRFAAEWNAAWDYHAKMRKR